MAFYDMVEQVMALLQRRRRVSYRPLKREFALDDAALEDLTFELIEVQRVAADENGAILVWTGAAGAPATTGEEWAETAPQTDRPTKEGVKIPAACGGDLYEQEAQETLEISRIRQLAPLVGRERDVGLLLDRWAQAKEGLGPVVLLSGEAGIGKSRLAQALREHVAGELHTRVECRGLPYHQHSAFYPVTELLQRAMGFERENSPEAKVSKLEETVRRYGLSMQETIPLLAALLGLFLSESRYPPLALNPQWQRQLTLEAVSALVLELAAHQPLLAIVEDLHWVDPSTLEVLGILLEQAPTARLMLVLTARPDFRVPWGNRAHFTTLTLTRLRPVQVERILTAVASGKPLPRAVVEQVVTKTDGVPLFVEELTKMVLESGLLQEREDRYELAGPLPPLAIPATLQDSLMARLDRLSTAKTVAQLGATIGRRFDYELLQAVAPLDEATLRGALSQLVEAELLYQRGLPPQATYSFKHALIQEAAYESLLLERRRALHARIVESLPTLYPGRRAEQIEQLAYHALRGELWEKAVDYWRQAGANAYARSANREAVACFEQALGAMRHLPESRDTREQAIDLHLELRTALVPLGERGQILSHLRQAESLAEALDDHRRLCGISAYLGYYFCLMGEYDRAMESSKSALTLARRMRYFDLTVRTHFYLGMIHYAQGDYRRALSYLMTNVTSLEGPLLRERFGLADLASVASRTWSVWCVAELGEFSAGSRYADEAVRIAEMVEQPYSQIQAAFAVSFLYVWAGSQGALLILSGMGPGGARLS